MKLAVIDIGSNSVRLMLWADGKALFKRIHTTRLGEGLALFGVLSDEAIERTASAVSEFYKEAKEAGAQTVYAFATAAVRSAQNGAVFCLRVKALTGLTVDVIAGKEEALLGIKGALKNADGGMIDIGGASTEICFQQGGVQVFSESLDIGAVRLFDKCGDDGKQLCAEIDRCLSSLSGIVSRLPVVAVGGTATTLASVKLGLSDYDAAAIQGCRLTVCEVEELSDKLLNLTAAQRRLLPGMDVRRADIIGGGALLLSRLMCVLCLDEIFTSDSDNLEGYLVVRGIV